MFTSLVCSGVFLCEWKASRRYRTAVGMETSLHLQNQQEKKGPNIEQRPLLLRVAELASRIEQLLQLQKKGMRS